MILALLLINTHRNNTVCSFPNKDYAIYGKTIFENKNKGTVAARLKNIILSHHMSSSFAILPSFDFVGQPYCYK